MIQNPRGNHESAKAITLRSGKEVGQGKEEMEVDMEAKDKEVPQEIKGTPQKNRQQKKIDTVSKEPST